MDRPGENSNQCDFASSQASNLRTHLKIHSGEKSHKCRQCNCASSEASKLRRYLKIHIRGKQSQWPSSSSSPWWWVSIFLQGAALTYVQLESSSRAIHGGAYFSAIFGRKFNPTTVLRPSQPLACYWRVIFPALCHFSFVFEKYTVLKAAFQEDFFKNGQNGFLTSVILHFFCNSCQRIDPCDHVRMVRMASSLNRN